MSEIVELIDLSGGVAADALLDAPAELLERAAAYAAQSLGKRTQQEYSRAWRGFADWCGRHGVDPLSGSAQAVALYLTERAESGVSSSEIDITMAAIKHAYKLANRQIDTADPYLSMVRDGIRRTLGERPKRKAAAATPGVLRALLAGTRGHDSAIGVRDRAMLLLLFGGALRRDELVNLRIEDIKVVPGKGLAVTIGRSKTDQTGVGQVVAVAANPKDAEFCPLVAFQRWMERRGTTDVEAPLFCSVHWAGKPLGTRLDGRDIARMIKSAAAGACLDPSQFSGHSPRRGILTAASRARAPVADMMRHARHKTPEITMAYVAEAEMWNHNISDLVFNDG